MSRPLDHVTPDVQRTAEALINCLDRSLGSPRDKSRTITITITTPRHGATTWVAPRSGLAAQIEVEISPNHCYGDHEHEHEH